MNRGGKEKHQTSRLITESRRLCRNLQVETHWELLVGAAAGGGRGGLGMIYEQTSAGAGGSESAVDGSGVEDRCGNKMLFKGGTGRGKEEGRKEEEEEDEDDEEEEESILHLSIGLLDPR